MKKILAACIATLLAAFATACTPTVVNHYTNAIEDRKSECVANLLPNVVELQYGASFGTGFIYTFDGGDPIMLTNFHLSGTDSFYAENLSARFYGTTDYVSDVIEVLGYDATYDTVVLRILSNAPKIDCTDLRAKINVLPKAGEDVLLVGNSTGNGLSVFDGIVSAAEKTIEIDGKTLATMSTTAAVNVGCSGCPVVNTEGEFLGIGFAQSRTFSESPVQDMSYVLPAEIVDAICELALHYSQNELYCGKQIPHLSNRIQLRWNALRTKATAQLVDLMCSGEFTNDGFTVTDTFNGRLRSDDVIEKINGRDADGYIGITAALYATSRPDVACRLTVRRAGETIVIE